MAGRLRGSICGTGSGLGTGSAAGGRVTSSTGSVTAAGSTTAAGRSPAGSGGGTGTLGKINSGTACSCGSSRVGGTTGATGGSSDSATGDLRRNSGNPTKPVRRGGILVEVAGISSAAGFESSIGGTLGGSIKGGSESEAGWVVAMSAGVSREAGSGPKGFETAGSRAEDSGAAVWEMAGFGMSASPAALRSSETSKWAAGFPDCLVKAAATFRTVA